MTLWNTPSESDQAQLNIHDVFTAGERNHHISNTAYPIAHKRTWGPYKVKTADHQSVMVEAFQGLNNISLYSHIPFCETRCYFCEYTVVGKSELDETQKYMEHLGRELQHYKDLLGPRTLHGFDIGGGTPSFVDAGLIDTHIQQVTNAFTPGEGFEISIETTPKIAANEPTKIQAYAASGIKRISMGIQITQPDLLKALGRAENGSQHMLMAAEHIRQAGFKKFNVDLMYGFAGQSTASWEATLRYAIKLAPEYVTLYRMRYKLTRVSNQAPQVIMQQIHEQAALAKTMLNEAGYFANPGKNTYSKVTGDTGTSAYLTGRVIQGASYLGLGLGAQTFTDTSISYNAGAVGKNLSPYFKAMGKGQLPIQDLYALPKTHMMAKMVAVSFYFGEINLEYFKRKFGVSLEEAYGPAVEYALDKGLMAYSDSVNGQEFNSLESPPMGAHNSKSLSLTPKGARHFNGTIALFFAPSVQAYLIERYPETATDMHRNQRAAEKVSMMGNSK